jgi:Cytochrome c3
VGWRADSFLRAARWSIIFVVVTLSGHDAGGQTTPFSGISLPTKVHVDNTGWWPTQGDAARDQYVGTAVCAQCHGPKAATYRTAAMSHASMRVQDSESLRQHDRLAFQQGRFSYQLTTAGESSTLKVSNGAASVSAELLWAVGAAHMGQTYLYQKNGSWYESRLSFFGEPQALDITPGHERAAPTNLENALGLKQDPPSEIHRCFGCHTTASMTRNEFDPFHAAPGVTCEGCHGPGAKHVEAVKSGTESAKDLIFNPARLDPVEQVDFCGACHRTWQDVVGNGLTGVGVLNVRFAPYRLENSKCWKLQDARLACTACHDPHKPLVREAASYDSNCLQCHATKGAAKSAEKPGAACPVATKDCVTCHMPKVEPPNLHSSFTDHWIRIVKPGKPYPN